MELKGTIERIIYENEHNNYKVFSLKSPGFKQPITVVGYLLPITPGEDIEVSGEWRRHKEYGKQFLAKTCRTIAPTTEAGILKYLSSGLIKGIGKEYARRLVSKFGEQTLDIIENQPKKLLTVNGIGQKRYHAIIEAWRQQRAIRDIMLFLYSVNIGSSLAMKIFKKYGADSISLVKANPYQLAVDIKGIGFKIADSIAAKLGLSQDSPDRIKAALVHCLNDAAADGHTMMPQAELLAKAKELLELDEPIILDALQEAAKQDLVVLEETKKGSVIVYLKGYHYAENMAAQNLARLINTPRSIREIDMARAIDWVEKQHNIQLADKQKQAIRMAIENKVMILTGGPGTGKTTIIRCIISIFSKLGLRILLAAPTGRAAKRMSETTGHKAVTIHRLLGFEPSTGTFRYNQDHPLKAKLLILDEVSMIDILLFHHLLKAIHPTASLIMVGDMDQLPSVGAGNVIRDLIYSNAIPTTKLDQIFRQAKRSLIVLNAHKINNGEFPIIPKPDKAKKNDFYFIEDEKMDHIVGMIEFLVSKRIPERYGILPHQIQVITPMHKGLLGTHNLNQRLQEKINPKKGESINAFGFNYRPGDRVMQLQNNYDKDVFNGDIGFIAEIDNEYSEISVNFYGRKVTYDRYDLDQLTLAYAITVHKSQGSEYPAVVVPYTVSHYMMLQRNLLYTAITRARKLVVIIGQKKAIYLSLSRSSVIKRHSMLDRRLIKILKEVVP